MTAEVVGDDWRNWAECAKTPEARALYDRAVEVAGTQDELSYPTAEHKAICGRCPVAVECLNYALEYGMEGIWGGTSDYQRRQLNRPRSRARCPNCDSNDVVPENGHELCLRCATSWPAI